MSLLYMILINIGQENVILLLVAFHIGSLFVNAVLIAEAGVRIRDL
jgi:hypothetical protein